MAFTGWPLKVDTWDDDMFLLLSKRGIELCRKPLSRNCLNGRERSLVAIGLMDQRPSRKSKHSLEPVRLFRIAA